MDVNEQKAKNEHKLVQVFVAFAIAYGALLGFMQFYKQQELSPHLPDTSIPLESTAQDQLLEKHGIAIDTIKAMEVVESPISVKGIAKKDTYPNAEFNALIMDDAGNVLGTSIVRADENGEIVNFETSLEYDETKAETDTGRLFVEDLRKTEDGDVQLQSYFIRVRFSLENTDVESNAEQ
jgi:hypothetical protein